MSYLVGVDVWEGNLDVPEDLFLANDIEYMLVRMNDIRGANRMDKNFAVQWKQASGMLPAPYYVYGPGWGAQANLKFVLDNAPDCPCIFVDAEVRAYTITKQKYAADFQWFCDELSKRFKVKIYTGGGFMDIMTIFPQNYDYWWGYYYASMYPKEPETWTYAKLHSVTQSLPWITDTEFWKKFNPKIGPVKLVQCSGDRIILPGTNRVLDINIFPGTRSDYSEFLGYTTKKYKTTEEKLEALIAACAAKGITI